MTTVNIPDQILLTDGGMGQELLKRGSGDLGGIWSAQALLDAPEIVQGIHEDYIRAGAQLLITNSYATTRSRLANYDIEHRYQELNQTAGKLAQDARRATGRSDVLIAGCLPPMVSSYRADLVRPFGELVSLYEEHASVIAPYVDLYLAETMSTVDEARAAATAAAKFGKPIWISWTVKDSGPPMLRSDESLADAYKALDALPVEAVLVNCSVPEAISLAVPILSRLTDKPVGAYANGFHHIPTDWRSGSGIDKLEHRHDLGPEAYAMHAMDWISAGATIIGGCCEVGPEHIAYLRERLDERIHTPAAKSLSA